MQDAKALELAKAAIKENQHAMETQTAKVQELEAELVVEQENLEKVMESLKGNFSLTILSITH